MERVKSRGRFLVPAIVLLGSVLLSACGQDEGAKTPKADPLVEFLADNPELGQGNSNVPFYAGLDTDFRLCRSLGGQPSREDHPNAGFTFECETIDDSFRAYVKDDGGELSNQDRVGLCKYGEGIIFYSKPTNANVCYLPETTQAATG